MGETRARQIRRAVEMRDIKEVLHFTQLTNLPGIIEHGFLPRRELEIRDDVHAQVVDSQRLDGDNDAISVSVFAFNPKMFAFKRSRCPNDPWVVLALCSSILWKRDCRFYRINAASSRMQRRYGDRGHVFAFEEMFAENGDDYRERTEIPSWFTTFPDAEVQVLSPFGPDYIRGAWVDREEVVQPVNEMLAAIPGQERNVYLGKFDPRFHNGSAWWG